MKCLNCNYEMKEGLKFCPKCGTKVVPSDQVNSHENEVETEVSEQNAQEYPHLEGFVVSTSRKACTGNSLKTTSVLTVALVVMRVIMAGRSLGFKGTLRDMARSLNDALPLWIVNIAIDVAIIYLFMHLIDVYYSQGKRSQYMYSVPIVWGVADLLLVATNFIEMDYNDIRFIGYLSVAVFALLFIVVYQLLKTKFSWLGKVIIAYCVLSLAVSLSPESILLFILHGASVIFMAITFQKELSSYYD